MHGIQYHPISFSFHTSGILIEIMFWKMMHVNMLGDLIEHSSRKLQWYTIVYSGGIRRFDGHCFILYKRSQLRDVLVPFFSTLLMRKSDECRVNANAANALPPSIARSFANVTLILPDTRVLVVHEEVTSALTMSLLSNNRQYRSSIHFLNEYITRVR